MLSQPDDDPFGLLSPDIWGQYRPQKKCWGLSLAFQAVLVLLLFTLSSSPMVQQKLSQVMPLIGPDIAAYLPEMPQKQRQMTGGGGGGDRSPLPASKGRLPKASLKQFTPPMAVANNDNPKLTMDPSLIIPPDVPLPQIPAAFVYLGCWFLMAGAVYYFLGMETKGKSIEQIDQELTAAADLSTAQVRRA